MAAAQPRELRAATRQLDEAAGHLARARASLAGLPADRDAARIELALIEGFIASRHDLADEVAAALDRARSLLDGAALSDEDRACFAARHADQCAYRLNRAGDCAAALALYDALPAADLCVRTYSRLPWMC